MIACGGVARRDALAEAAGLSRGQDWADDEPVTIDGRAYRLTIEPDPDGWRYGDDDVTGRIVERDRDDWTGHPRPVDPPMIALGGALAYDPGPAYDPASHLSVLRRSGMARGPAHERRRTDLLREAEPYLREWTANRYGPGGDERNRVLTLTDPDTGESASLCGMDGLSDDLFGRSWLYDVLTELAGEIEHRRLLAAERARDLAYAATAHG